MLLVGAVTVLPPHGDASRCPKRLQLLLARRLAKRAVASFILPGSQASVFSKGLGLDRGRWLSSTWKRAAFPGKMCLDGVGMGFHILR